MRWEFAVGVAVGVAVVERTGLDAGGRGELEMQNGFKDAMGRWEGRSRKMGVPGGGVY